MTWERTLAYAFDGIHAPVPHQVPRQRTDKEICGGLTPREREVTILIKQGKSNPEIAETLVVSERTVTTHVTHILSKLGFTSRTQIASWATAQKLTQA
jgi:non-specific serine/threonine protein kinase